MVNCVLPRLPFGNHPGLSLLVAEFGRLFVARGFACGIALFGIEFCYQAVGLMVAVVDGHGL